MSDIPQTPGFKKVAYTGVIYVMQKAMDCGYRPFDDTWANLGQGAPETGPLLDAPDRASLVQIPIHAHEYGPVSGIKDLRQKVADFYNYFYRQDKKSKYTWQNVCMSGGGRVALARIAASLGDINLGHILPDYTAYEELLGSFKTFQAIPILLRGADLYQLTAERLKEEIVGKGLQAVLLSNPCNPTGQVIQGKALQDCVKVARECQSTLILDEFYSHYIYTEDAMVSAAQYVENVDEDPVILIDGLTKNWRYPGWRLAWTVGPKDVIEVLTSAGSFLDGGGNHPLQQHAVSLLEPQYVLAHSKALKSCFLEKKEYALKRLIPLGIEVEAPPQGAFYIWARLSNLKAPLNDGFEFFKALLEQKVIVVPGVFFDVNPGKRRPAARFSEYVRISFGPCMEELKLGLDQVGRLISD